MIFGQQLQNTNQIVPNFWQQQYQIPLSTASSPCCGTSTVNVKQEKETTMSLETEARDYLLRRAQNVYYDVQSFLPKMFNINVNNRPKTYKELIDAIQNNKFTLDAEITKSVDAHVEEIADDDCEYFDFSVWEGIIWNGPQPDRKGYQTAKNELDTALTNIKDVIMTGSNADGLAALNALKDFKPSNAPAAN